MERVLTLVVNKYGNKIVEFVPYINQLLDEKVLTGSGFTALETMRHLALTTLGDLVHHVRTSLPSSSLCAAVYLFSRHAHDPSLPCAIHIMSCKLLLNLVDCIVKVDGINVSTSDFIVF